MTALFVGTQKPNVAVNGVSVYTAAGETIGSLLYLGTDVSSKEFIDITVTNNRGSSLCSPMTAEFALVSAM
jgi:hypothetical protein